MAIPSIKTIETKLYPVLYHQYRHHWKEYARLIRSYMHDPYVSALLGIDRILHGYGVECIFGKDGNPAIEYVNLGDTYTTTVCYDIDKRKFIISDWGTIVETQPRRFE